MFDRGRSQTLVRGADGELYSVSTKGSERVGAEKAAEPHRRELSGVQAASDKQDWPGDDKSANVWVVPGEAASARVWVTP